MKKRVAVILLFSSLAGCDALPRDPNGTLDRVRQSHTIRVGLAGPAMPQRARALLAALAQQESARIDLRTGSLERLIVELDADRVDLVIAEVTKRTPWKKLVAPGPPLLVLGKGQERTEWRALMKNGENRWIMQVEKASRAVAPKAS
jgi:DNA-binding transcriptional LysR family regulator